MAIDPTQLDLPQEIGVKDAASILNVDRKTVLGYIAEGVLPARNIALPSSQRPVWKIKLAHAIELRTGYVVQQRVAATNGHKKRTKPIERYQPQILKRK